MLHCSFITVDEYLKGIQTLCNSLELLDASALVYLAAAVSDFYLTEDEVVRLI